MRTLVVIPTYNEADCIVELVVDLVKRDPALDVLIVDDASPDGTGDLINDLAQRNARIRLHRRSAKLGLGSAYLAGFRYGIDRNYARVVTMDGDYSHHPRHVPALLEAMMEHDMVVGSRYIPGGAVRNWALWRRVLSANANRFTRWLLGLPVHDCTSGYRCYSREVLMTVEPESVRASGYSFLEEMIWRVHRSGFRIGEIPIVFEDRRSGTSKIDRAEILRAACHVITTAVAPPVVPVRSSPPACMQNRTRGSAVDTPSQNPR